MSLSVLHNHTLSEDGGRGHDAGTWPVHASPNDTTLTLFRAVAAAILRGWSRLAGGRIQMRPMSRDWLRLHEVESEKHPGQT